MKGKFLVATRALGDPNFVRSVVLVCDHSEAGAMGLIVNRPLSLPVAKVLPKAFLPSVTQGRLYQGGPVQPDHLLLLHGIDRPGLNAHPVCTDVFLGGELEVLREALLEAGKPPPLLRCFLGYSGWSAGQLEAEIAEGAWIPRPARPQEVFGADLETLWARLVGSGSRPDPYGRPRGPELN